MAISQTDEFGAAESATQATWRFVPYFLACLFAVYFFITFDLVDGLLFSGDTDDLLRKLEVRRFVDGAAWFDLSFPSVRMPDVYVTPWSRLIDVPYAVTAWILGPFVGTDRGLDLAFLIWPPVMAAFFALAFVVVLRHLVPERRDLPIALMLAALLPATFGIWEFSPGRVDHHNVQILLLLTLVYGLARWDRHGGVIAGIALSMSVAVGLETLPVLAAAIAALGLAWVVAAPGSTNVLRAFGLSAALSALVLMVILVAPSDYLTMRSDAFSAPYAMTLVAFGVVSAVATHPTAESWTIANRVILIGAGGLLTLGAVLWCYPAMLEGPLPMIDGLAKTYWFDRIDQEKSALQMFATSDERAILHLLAAAGIVILALPQAAVAARSGKAALPVICMVLVAVLLSACISGRFIRVALGVIPVLLPVAFATMRSPQVARATKIALITGLAVLFSAAGLRSYAFPPPPRTYDAFDYLIMNDCRDYSFADVSTLPAGRMMTPPALGLQIISHDPGRVSVSSISFHRASPAMSDVIKVMMGKTPAENADLLQHFDYLGICRTPGKLDGQEKLPLYRSLLSGESIRGLVELTGPKDALMIFRIDHAAFK